MSVIRALELIMVPRESNSYVRVADVVEEDIRGQSDRTHLLRVVDRCPRSGWGSRRQQTAQLICAAVRHLDSVVIAFSNRFQTSNPHVSPQLAGSAINSRKSLVQSRYCHSRQYRDEANDREQFKYAEARTAPVTLSHHYDFTQGP